MTTARDVQLIRLPFRQLQSTLSNEKRWKKKIQLCILHSSNSLKIFLNYEMIMLPFDFKVSHHGKAAAENDPQGVTRHQASEHTTLCHSDQRDIYAHKRVLF